MRAGMDQAPIVAARHREKQLTLLLALLLAVVLTFAWAGRDWHALMAFRLPDNDDMMRLAEVRDWLNGQSLWDLSQHRLGPPGGASMHWSRIADLGPATIIVTLTPLFGRVAAEQAMLLLYPGGLFLAALLIGARIVRRLSRSAETLSVVLLALAFPSSSLFIPGRIDHHGLQIVLVLWFAERLVARPGWRSGAAMGVATAISLAIGLETLPLFLAGMAALFARHVVAPARAQLLAFALVLGGLTLVLLGTIRPMIWPHEWCDGFTPASTDATLIAAAWFVVVALLPLRRWAHRLAAGAALGALALPLVLHTSGVCLSGPYGAIDPMLQRLWMSRVGEALSLFAQDSAGVSVSYGAYGLVGAGALIVLLRAGAWRSRKWQAFAILYFAGVLLTLAQIRATYVVSALAAVPTAVLLQRIRARSDNVWLRVGAWLVAVGFCWNLIGICLEYQFAQPMIAARQRYNFCTGASAVKALAALPPGRVIAPLDSAAYIIGGTRHSAIAAPYHRNNSGNLAMYRFFLGPASQALAIARAWHADYVVACPDSFGELGPAMVNDRRRLIGRIRAGEPPAWLKPLPHAPDAPVIFRIQAGL
jgi:hypothetical protein